MTSVVILRKMSMVLVLQGVVFILGNEYGI